MSDDIDALEAERQRIAELMEQRIVSPLNLLLAQANVYEQTLGGGQAGLAASVLASLARQVLQNARDVQDQLHPAALESLGLEAALELLASSQGRVQGVRVSLALQRLSERLPASVELVLYRAAQDMLDSAAALGHAGQVWIRLEQSSETISLRVWHDGTTHPPQEATRRRVESLGGQFEAPRPVEIILRFPIIGPNRLTEREIDVLRLLAEGKSNQEIADALVIGRTTVKFHLDNIYAKLNVKTRTEAAVFALRAGWSSAPR
jgi:DNA-binding NarL/FixJ family response regulator